MIRIFPSSGRIQIVYRDDVRLIRTTDRIRSGQADSDGGYWTALATLAAKVIEQLESDIRVRPCPGGFAAAIDGTSGWVTVLGVWPTPEAARQAARDMRNMGSERIATLADIDRARKQMRRKGNQ